MRDVRALQRGIPNEHRLAVHVVPRRGADFSENSESSCSAAEIKVRSTIDAKSSPRAQRAVDAGFSVDFPDVGAEVHDLDGQGLIVRRTIEWYDEGYQGSRS